MLRCRFSPNCCLQFAVQQAGGEGAKAEAHNILFPHFGSAAAATATRMRNLFPISYLKKLSTANFVQGGGGRRQAAGGSARKTFQTFS